MFVYEIVCRKNVLLMVISLNVAKKYYSNSIVVVPPEMNYYNNLILSPLFNNNFEDN